MVIDFLSASNAQVWFSLVIVVLGGIITYYFNISIGKQKHTHELKRQAYLDFLDVMLEGEMLYLTKVITDKKPKEEQKPFLIKEIIWDHNYKKAFFFVELFGSNKIIEFIAQNCLNTLKESAQDYTKYTTFENDLMKMIKEDLLEEHRWWQFWR